MTDAEYLFQQTSRELKRIGHGARAKKKGGKSKSCKLGSDYMTAAQKKKMNGDVKVYQMNKPMAWKNFMSMPNDLQRDYILFLQTKKGRKCDIADMFGCKVATLDSYLYSHHRGKFSFPKGKVEMDPVWLDWLTEPDGGGETGGQTASNRRNRTSSFRRSRGTVQRITLVQRETGANFHHCHEDARMGERLRNQCVFPQD